MSAASAWPTPASSARGSRRVFLHLGRPTGSRPRAKTRLAGYGIAPPGIRAAVPGDRHRRLASPRAACAVPALRVDPDPRAVAFRLDAMQGAASLRRLSRAFRLLQAALTPASIERRQSGSALSKFHPLTIASVARETRDAIALTFDVPAALRDAFRFEPGQHLTLRTDHRQRRRAALVFDLLGGAGRHAAGGGEKGAWRRVLDLGQRATSRRGETIEVMPPLGHFNVPLAAANRKHYLGFAAGSGITPLLSIIKTTLADRAAQPVHAVLRQSLVERGDVPRGTGRPQRIASSNASA